MKMLTAEDVAGFLDSSGLSPHAQARNDLVVEIRDAVSEAIESGNAPEGTPFAATFTLDELRERGISGKRGSGLKASRNDRGPIHKVATLDENTVLVVLNDTWTEKDGTERNLADFPFSDATDDDATE